MCCLPSSRIACAGKKEPRTNGPRKAKWKTMWDQLRFGDGRGSASLAAELLHLPDKPAGGLFHSEVGAKKKSDGISAAGNYLQRNHASSESVRHGERTARLRPSSSA